MFGELVGRACYQRNGGTATMRFRWSSVGRVQTGTFVYQLFDCTTGHTSAGLTRRLGYETPTGTSGHAEATVKVNPAHKYRMRISGGGRTSARPTASRAGRLLEQRAAPGQPEVAGRDHLRVSAGESVAYRHAWGRWERGSRCHQPPGPPLPCSTLLSLTHLPPQRRPRRTAGGGATPCAAPEGLRHTRLTRTTAHLLHRRELDHDHSGAGGPIAFWDGRITPRTRYRPPYRAIDCAARSR